MRVRLPRQLDVRLTCRRPIVQPCSLEGHTYQIDPDIGCEHLCHYLDRELAALEPQGTYMGWSSDPYQPAEGIQLRTRRVLELLASRGHSVCILTKSGLVARDAGLLATMPGSSAGVSLAFQDERVRQLSEASAPSNEQRIDAVRVLKEAGIWTYALICAVMPFITEVKRLVETVAAWADTVWVYSLSMKAEADRNWREVQRILERHFPQMAEPYRQIAFSAKHPCWAELRHDLEGWLAETRLDLRVRL
jgi:DNA repair photolyase